MNLTYLVELINEERKRRGYEGRPQSIRAAAMIMAITHPALIDILKERVRPSPETCAKIADYLHISVGTVLVLAGHLPPGALGVAALTLAQEEAARLIDELPNEAWRYAALDQLRRLRQLADERTGFDVVGAETKGEVEEDEARRGWGSAGDEAASPAPSAPL